MMGEEGIEEEMGHPDSSKKKKKKVSSCRMILLLQQISLLLTLTLKHFCKVITCSINTQDIKQCNILKGV